MTGTQRPGAAYEAQLAARVTETLPDLDGDERLEMIAAMTPADLSTSLAWIATAYPQVFDFAIVRDRDLTSRLAARLVAGPAEDEDDEPYCATCGAPVGIFRGHGDGWHHWRGEATVESPVELYDAGHEPEVAWRPAGDR